MERDALLQKRIGVLMGGLSSEREISLASGQAVLASLLRIGYQAHAIDAGRDLPDRLKEERTEVAFIALHGRWGEDGTVQGLLEMMAVPYTGSGVLGSALAMDKCLGKLLLMALDIPTPAYEICRSEKDVQFPLPFVVKPAREGSTVGISIVRREEEIEEAVRTAFRLRQQAAHRALREGKGDNRGRGERHHPPHRGGETEIGLLRLYLQVYERHDRVPGAGRAGRRISRKGRVTRRSPYGGSSTSPAARGSI